MKTGVSIAIVMALSTMSASPLSAQDQPAPSASTEAPGNPAVKPPDDTASAPLAKGHNSFTKSQALSRITKAGFTQVTGLTLDGDGLWQASAMRDGHPVRVAIDYKGDVAAQ